MKRLLPSFLSALLAISTLIFPASAEETVDSSSVDFRAVWVSTVYHLDYPSAPTDSAATLKKEADEILDNCKEMGMTAVFLQVRPASDALYPSELYPWSVYLTGDQDTSPKDNFDPLAYWVAAAHERGLELHAWINPYRVTKNGSDDLSALSDKSPAKQHPEWLVEHNKNYYFDPGIPQVQEYILKGIQEILDHYDVDGIHMDDYFYPGPNFNDAATYETYGEDFSNIDDWRRNNVNTLVKSVKELTDKKDNVVFGISPAGIWANESKMPGGSATNGGQSYFNQFADSKKWVEEEMVDYICPQIYWNIGYSVADYEILVNWWADVVSGTKVKLVIGMADYRAGNSSDKSPWYGIEEIKRQTQMNRSIPEVSGEAHFRYQFLLSVEGLKDFYQTLHQNEPQKENSPSYGENVLSHYPAADGSGQWLQYNDHSWGFYKKDANATGWQKIDSSWYYFDVNGIMQTGWMKDADGKWYYLRSSGAMKTNWFEDTDGSWYFLGGNGAMKSGWIAWGKDWYYMNGSGRMVTSRWIEYGGDWYYLTASGVMATNTTVNGYRINASGVWVR